MVDLEYLEKERKLLWEAIEDLKKNQLKKLEESYNKLLQTIPQDVADLKSYKASIARLKTSFKDYKDLYEDISSKCEDTLNKAKLMDSTYDDVLKLQDNLNLINKDVIQKAETIKKSIDTNLDLPSKIDATVNSIDNWNASYKQTTKQVQEIKQLYIEIFGGEVIDDEGVSQKTSGLVDELNTAYNNIESKLNSLEKDTQEKYISSFNKWNNNYEALKGKILDLLPGAMSAGLASAYRAKREREQSERKYASCAFYCAIALLILVSILPVFINIKLLMTSLNQDVFKTVNLLLHLIWAMVPVYVPILWVAIFANKRINLSKKLIEEYSHKEAVAMTYEGLAKQVENLDNSDLSKELRNRLIDNTLSASFENPSKYIVNYNKCDNPILEILNNKNLLKLIKSQDIDSLGEKLQKLFSLKVVENIENFTKKSKSSDTLNND